ncbi:MAG: cytochrome P450, partial [Ktedonobacteraceae bacterium]
MTQETLLRQITDYANRANPYPLYAQLRETPVSRQEDGTYVVSTYREIVELLHDPRISSDERKRSQAGNEQPEHQRPPTLISLDPPEHDRLRRLAMRQFGPPHRPELVESIRVGMANSVNILIDRVQDQRQIDIFESVAYPFPVTVICELLGVPREDEPRFHVWAEAIIAPMDSEEAQQKRDLAFADLGQYLGGLAEAHSKHPGQDMLSGLTTDNGPEGRMSPRDLVSTAILLLIAGHETTVNLTDNGMLTLLR